MKRRKRTMRYYLSSFGECAFEFSEEMWIGYLEPFFRSVPRLLLMGLFIIAAIFVIGIVAFAGFWLMSCIPDYIIWLDANWHFFWAKALTIFSLGIVALLIGMMPYVKVKS